MRLGATLDWRFRREHPAADMDILECVQLFVGFNEVMYEQRLAAFEPM